ncbi:hypothetical protein [Streptomyces sp. NBC_01477]|uniref:hypothetical protein n=1 Tax=Streptomyces sp. NBC_01477 TaxID=2976015 RepID=UPI002E33EAFC|nr:hypothetical protein [Streptomyces sp. NBC_01477]
MRLRPARTIATLAATAALATAGVTAAAPADADTGTTINCTQYLIPTWSGCDAPVGTGAPYVITAHTYWVVNFLGPWYIFSDVTKTCANLVQYDATTWKLDATSGCTPASP